MSAVTTLETPHGEARLLRDPARRPLATLLLGHGAGGGPESPDLAALAAALPGQGFSVVRLEQPWRVAGRRVAPRPAVLDECLRAAARRVRVRTPLVVGGRSAGARSAARCAESLGAAAYLGLAFPLHPPGRPERSRLHELLGVGVPALVVQGERDALGRPDEFPEEVEMAVVPGGDHSFRVLRSGPLAAEDALGLVVEATLEWLVREVVGNRESPRGVVPS